MRLDEIRRILLALTGHQAPPDVATGLGQADWQILSDLAAQHRLEPYLHAHCGREPGAVAIPCSIRERWRAAYRTSGIRALAKRKVLLDTHALLEREGIRAAALKGAWAAWHAYRAPAERPMRDIDLLVAGDEALRAFELLLAHGYRQEEASARTAAQSLHHDKHLPPLLAPDGTRLELHMRLWERSEAIGWAMPPDESAAMLARAGTCGNDPVRYLSVKDRLVHCIVHGAYSNRLNGGPLTLLDLAAIVRQGGIDWSAFWQRANEGGWARGAALLLHLTDHFCVRGVLEASRCTLTVDPEVLASAPDLLLQDLEARKAVGMVAGVASKMQDRGLVAGAGALLRKLRGRDRAVLAPDTAGGPREGFGHWAARRLGETAKALLNRDVRHVAYGTSRLGEWLDGRV